MPDLILVTAVIASIALFWSIWFMQTHPVNAVPRYIAEAVLKVFYGSVVIAIIFWTTFILY